MTEEEEFEFRARMERERGAAPAAPAAPAEPTGSAAFGVFPKQRATPPIVHNLRTPKEALLRKSYPLPPQAGLIG